MFTTTSLVPISLQSGVTRRCLAIVAVTVIISLKFSRLFPLPRGGCGRETSLFRAPLGVKGRDGWISDYGHNNEKIGLTNTRNNKYDFLKCDPSEIKFTDESFWNFPWKFSTKHCFEKKKNTIKTIGHHSCLRDMMGQSYPICACISAYYGYYSSVHVTFCGSLKHTLLK